MSHSELTNVNIAIPDHAARLMKMLESAGFETWCVGGCVRDALRGCTPHDWDLCTSAMPEEMLEVFKNCRTIPTGIKHGTITVLNGGEPIEITTYRCDGDYLDHRRPSNVQFVRDIRSDLERRDFTMNAICLDLRGRLYDPFDGQGDIERGIIRCVGEPRKRFDEDALRILRAVRFAAKTGFPIESETLKAADDMRGLLDSISVERIWQELKALLIQPHAGDALREYKNIISQILPEAAASFDFPQNTVHHCYDVWGHITHSVDNIKPDPVLRAVMLFHDLGKPQAHTVDADGISHFKGHPKVSAQIADKILDRLKCDKASRKRIITLVAEHDNRIPASSAKRFIAKYGYDFYCDWLLVRRADTLAQSMYHREKKIAELDDLSALGERLIAEGSCLQKSDLALGGRELMALGFSGSEIGSALNAMLDKVIDGELENTPSALTDFCQTLKLNSGRDKLNKGGNANV